MSTMFQGCYLFKKRCDFTAGSGSEEPFHEFMDSLRHAYDVNVVKPNLFICAFSLFQGTDWHSHHKNPGRWPWFLFEPGYVTEVTEVFGLIKVLELCLRHWLSRVTAQEMWVTLNKLWANPFPKLPLPGSPANWRRFDRFILAC